ncbi:uncharacterized protein SPPG_04993 [Spizellomyces punctatus DAOM BR117]|uniref:Calcium/calmodulin-dependent protein kinase II association-domain domain-containing protein n=1 Tax=Spizellomyces punctatus (strain DAOM BR117) TaxID=645134 RepID=A0A0L0HDT2_SPIPD|nr:uncharacterized protein SPPG_04993 [Spizellomyces punctatus DAOM BR117]KNC99605.1 hypothetical protein SPPG_04993 [Spizellomyces punctatus DAOM BR117]|eukprot:XP_016607645.1 hypothetical protein SPPG_04993 [Spizellomyces punctatus DAOM BR117]
MPPLPHIFTDTKLETTIVNLTTRLVQSVAEGDWETYASLVSHDMTAFEPESGEHQVQGLDFHKFYFSLAHAQSATSPPPYASLPPATTTLVSPHVRILSSDRCSALITYVRLVQRVKQTPEGTLEPVTTTSQETRVWELDRKEGAWRNVHFHRSLVKAPEVIIKEVKAKL